VRPDSRPRLESWHIAAAPGFDQSHRRGRRNPGFASLRRICLIGGHRPSARPRGRYAELFSYDDQTRMFGLDHAE
jgi:hypothetical protein